MAYLVDTMDKTRLVEVGNVEGRDNRVRVFFLDGNSPRFVGTALIPTSLLSNARIGFVPWTPEPPKPVVPGANKSRRAKRAAERRAEELADAVKEVLAS